MLLRNEIQECTVRIADASFPVPFTPGLEFNPPVHGTWNIVHIGMNVPEAMQIYVCAINCMRGVVLTAAEMNCQDRFACVLLEEKDIMDGTVEDVTIEGVADVLRRLDKLPPAVLLFTVCTHHFLGCSLERIYGELEARFPDVVFVRCFMDPIMQKRGLTPDQKLRRSMGELLRDNTAETAHNACLKNSVSLLGCDFPLDAESDIKRILQEEQIPVKEIMDCSSFEEYRAMGSASHLVCTYPPGYVGISAAAKRLEKAFLYLPSCFGYDEIAEEWEKIYRQICGWSFEKQMSTEPDEIDTAEKNVTSRNEQFRRKIEREILACEIALSELGTTIKNTSIYIDGSVHPRPLGLARFLLEHRFQVKKVYLDSISKEEQKDFEYLKEHFADLELTAIIQAEGRVRKRENEELILAIGQKAAWYSGTSHFVNMVQGAGLWGFDGIRKMAGLMKEAYLKEKDTRDLVPRKGLGCESCV